MVDKTNKSQPVLEEGFSAARDDLCVVLMQLGVNFETEPLPGAKLRLTFPDIDVTDAQFLESVLRQGMD